MEPKEYYRLYPEILTHSWRDEYYTVRVFEYLLRNACDHIRTDDGQTVSEGTVVCNFEGLLQRLSYCEPVLSRALKSLLYSGDITYHEIKIRGTSFGIYTITLFPRQSNQEKPSEPEASAPDPLPSEPEVPNPVPEAPTLEPDLSAPEAHTPVASVSAKSTTKNGPAGQAPQPTKSKFCPSAELQRRTDARKSTSPERPALHPLLPSVHTKWSVALDRHPLIPTRPHIRGAPP